MHSAILCSPDGMLWGGAAWGNWIRTLMQGGGVLYTLAAGRPGREKRMKCEDICRTTINVVLACMIAEYTVYSLYN